MTEYQEILLKLQYLETVILYLNIMLITLFLIILLYVIISLILKTPVAVSSIYKLFKNKYDYNDLKKNLAGQAGLFMDKFIDMTNNINKINIKNKPPEKNNNISVFDPSEIVT